MHRFDYATCNSCYIDETRLHFETRIDEHIRIDKNSSICKHPHENEDCFKSFTFDCFSILDTAQTECQ